MFDSPVSVLLNTSGIFVDVANGSTSTSQNTGFIFVGVDSTNTAHFINTDTSGNLIVSGATQITNGTNSAAILNSNPSGTEYGLVVRNIPSGTQTVSVSGTPAVTITSGTVTANIGTTNGLALNATLTSGNQLTQLSNGTNSASLLNSTPSGSEYGLVVRNIPSGTQTVSISGTPSVNIANSPAVTITSGTVTANIGTTNGLALNATLTSGNLLAQISNGTNSASVLNTTPAGSEYGIITRNIPSGIQSVSISGTPSVNIANSPAVTVTSGTITANIGTTNGLALDSSLTSLSAKFGSLGQKTSAGSAPVVIASDQSAIAVTGTVTATNASIGANGSAIPTSSTQVGGSDGTNLQVFRGSTTTPAGTEFAIITRNIPSGTQAIQSTDTGFVGSIASNGGIVATTAINGQGSLTLIITGVWSATLQFEASVDGTNFVNVVGRTPNSGTLSTNTAGNGTWRFSVGGFDIFRVRASAYTSGTASITIRNSLSSDNIVLTEALPTGANVIGAVTASGNFTVVGPGAAGSAISGNPVRVGASDGANTRNILSDTSGRLVVVGATASGTAVTGSPVLMGSSDGTNARNVLSDSSGRLQMVGAGAAGSAISGNPVLTGFTDGVNLQIPKVFNLNTGAGTDYTLGVVLHSSSASGGVELATATNPVRIDPTGTTTQPVSIAGTVNVAVTNTPTVTANIGTTNGLALNATLTSGAQISQIGNGSNTASVLNSTPAGTEYGLVVRPIPSGTQTVAGTVTANIGTTNGLALNATLTSGNLLSQISNGTNSASVLNSSPVGTEYGLIVRNIPSGTQAISAASLPLPTGAATESTLSTLNSKVGAGTKVSASSTSVVLASDVLYLPTRYYEPATFTALATGVQIGNGKSLLSIANAGSKIIRIQEVFLSNVSTPSGNGIYGVFQLRRIASHSSGTTISLIETMDSTDTLDSNISIKTGATVSGQSSSVLRRSLFNTGSWDANLTTTSFTHGLEIYFPIFSKSASDTKPIVIRNGEGCTLNFESNSTSGTYDIHLVFSQE